MINDSEYGIRVLLKDEEDGSYHWFGSGSPGAGPLGIYSNEGLAKRGVSGVYGPGMEYYLFKIYLGNDPAKVQPAQLVYSTSQEETKG